MRAKERKLRERRERERERKRVGHMYRENTTEKIQSLREKDDKVYFYNPRFKTCLSKIKRNFADIAVQDKTHY